MNIIEKIKSLLSEPVEDDYLIEHKNPDGSIERYNPKYLTPNEQTGLLDWIDGAFPSSGTYSGFQLSQVIDLSSGSFPPYYLDHPYYLKDQQNLPRIDYNVELVPGGEILVCEYCGTRYLFDKSKVTDALRKIRCIECGGSLV